MDLISGRSRLVIEVMLAASIVPSTRVAMPMLRFKPYQTRHPGRRKNDGCAGNSFQPQYHHNNPGLYPGCWIQFRCRVLTRWRDFYSGTVTDCGRRICADHKPTTFGKLRLNAGHNQPSVEFVNAGLIWFSSHVTTYPGLNSS